MGTKQYRTLIPLFDELRGERVIVRPYRESDAQSLFEAVAESRDHIRPWEPFADAHQSVEESQDLVIRWMAQWLLREYLAVGFWDQASGRYLGSSGLRPRDWELGYFEIGYWIRASETGHGYVTEMVKLLTDYAFTHLHARRVEIRCNERNERSAAVARRLGFVQEARLRNHALTHLGEVRTTLIFALTPEDREGN
jgi:ribosomal-protein-serine acetyltransferase